jgi:hypothetical protein
VRVWLESFSSSLRRNVVDVEIGVERLRIVRDPAAFDR